jgi:hypothetical protein
MSTLPLLIVQKIAGLFLFHHLKFPQVDGALALNFDLHGGVRESGEALHKIFFA